MRAIATAAVGALGLALLGTPGPATAAEKISLRIGAGHPAAATWITTIRELFMPRFAERVKAETEYEIQWTEAWGGSVCKLGECLEAVESGLLDMADLQRSEEHTSELQSREKLVCRLLLENIN